MPELPEVETIKNELAPHLIGRTVTGVTVLWEGVIRQPATAEFRARLTGHRIAGLGRRGKYLLIRLENSEWLIIHLKMSGALIVGPSPAAPRFTRAIINLDNGANIFFRDPRKFGRMWLVQDTASVVGGLGPEPLEPEFSPQLLARLLQKRSAPVKALLCDQKVIAGIGNLYADEALFLAGIHPLRSGGSLSSDEVKQLHDSIRLVLRAGIENKGASIQNYARPDGTLGSAHLAFLVPREKGSPCRHCGTPIERIT
ncbi:MAG: bifunctional DNA-formamidopyrimidine glycosylase/DNA-(apurinic or apyrimidinic site) lyase, partial [Chloroflexi bacterium]|nr:bifunctional DNA-formamidopyrimidine glycosylase/DNA-(apurinic or apyrimidinic site) lyase [Chloroflexota bacterium]